MKKFHTLLSFALLLASLSLPVHAQAPDANAPQAPQSAPAPAPEPAQAPSGPALESNRAPSAPDKVKDIERTQERMSEQAKPPKVRRQAKSKQSTQPETVIR